MLTPTPVTDLSEGDLVDLESDPYADPNGDGTCADADCDHYEAFAFEYGEVLSVEGETPDTVVVHTTLGSYGMPTTHRLAVAS